MKINEVIKGDCLKILNGYSDSFFQLVYIDPPFFTQKTQTAKRRDGNGHAEFEDTWKTIDDYLKWLKERLKACYRILKENGSIFVHCDWHASHEIRRLLDSVFGPANFRNEIIWSYRRWTNSTDFLQRSHQSIYFYAKSKVTKINQLTEPYSPTTNLDQIWQKRTRSEDGKSITKKDSKGDYEPLNIAKSGVPLRDVWDIPYLNPTAKERVGYPTQKPVELLERIVLLSTQEGDIVLDPMCGSGTTLIAAKTHNRSFVGVDISETAIELAEKRLKSVIISRSVVTKQGRGVFEEKVNSKNGDVAHILDTLDINMVYRNRNIDGYLKKTPNGKPVAVRVIGHNEDYIQARKGFQEALKKTRSSYGILIRDNGIKLNGTDQLSFVNQEADEDKIPVVEIGLDEIVKNPLMIYQIRPET